MSSSVQIETYRLPLEMKTSEHRQMAALYAAAMREPDDEDSLYEQYENLRDSDHVRVARIDGEVAGIAAYDFTRSSLYLGALAVGRRYRGQGFVGSTVLKHVINEGATLGADTVDLSCYAQTIPFYQSHQFEVVRCTGKLYDLRRELP